MCVGQSCQCQNLCHSRTAVFTKLKVIPNSCDEPLNQCLCLHHFEIRITLDEFG